MKKMWTKVLCIIFILIILLGLISISIMFYFNQKNKENILMTKEIINKINKHYNEFVKTNKETFLYNEQKKIIGKIGSNVELILNDIQIDEKTKYFSIKDLEGYYIKYSDVEIIEKKIENDNRYKKYILFNKNIITNNSPSFYDESDNLIYTLNECYEFPIIIMEKSKYGIEFNNRLLYIKNEDVKDIIDSNNTDLSNSSGIPVLNYHFVYENDDDSCNEIICHSANQIQQHFKYIKEKNYFTPTMKELEKYIDGEIQLPERSVVITFDDGGRAEIAKKYVDMYQINATLFLITSWYNKKDFESEYMEVHSHGHDLHNTGICPGGQGGAIKCLDKEKLLIDLRTSSEKLDGTTVFCYPFYEYNNYSIEVLKEAGFTMAFAGEYAGGKTRVTVGADKFRLPRWVIVDYTTFDLFKEYIS